MEEVLNIKKSDRKKISIFGYSIWRLIAYFLIYSVIGLIIETIFGVITKGVVESRQNFLYGPFCSIYGVGAIVMILFLKFFNKNNNTLFIGGCIIGSLTEYIISYLGEIFFNIVWWDYSDIPVNVNGRICVLYSIFWGLLAIYLISYVNPKIDKLLNFIKGKFSEKTLKIVIIFFVIFLIFNFFISSFALKLFYIRVIHNNDLKVENRVEIEQQYKDIEENEIMKKIIEIFFDDQRMIQTYPNLKVIDLDGKVWYFTEFFPDIQPYFYKFNTTFRKEIESIFNSFNPLNEVSNNEIKIVNEV